jgi:hypothetical protein
MSGDLRGPFGRDVNPIKLVIEECHEMRPDGRTTTPQTRALRAATRALRDHLDTLPIDVAVEVPGDNFLAGLAFTFARQRCNCAESIIGAGFGGTVLGAMAQSLLVGGLRWLWIGEQHSVAGPCSATCSKNATASA